LEEQAKKLWHVANLYMNPIVQEYAEKLVETMPGELKVGTPAGEMSGLLLLLEGSFPTSKWSLICSRYVLIFFYIFIAHCRGGLARCF